MIDFSEPTNSAKNPPQNKPFPPVSPDRHPTMPGPQLNFLSEETMEGKKTRKISKESSDSNSSDKLFTNLGKGEVIQTIDFFKPLRKTVEKPQANSGVYYECINLLADEFSPTKMASRNKLDEASMAANYFHPSTATTGHTHQSFLEHDIKPAF